MSARISILLHTSDYRGDHAADVVLAFEPKEGETLEQLVERVQLGQNKYAKGEHIQIRLIQDKP